MKRPLALLLCLASGIACAQYPSKPVRVMVPNPPGGATDTLGRLIAPRLGEALGQPVLIENRSGSNGNLATESVGKAAPDGYTLLLGADAQIVISPHLYAMSVDPVKDLVPLSTLVSTSMVLTINPALPARSLQEFVDYAKKAKPPLAYGSIGNGSQHHLVMEMLKAKAGFDMVHVPYKGGGPATLALVANEVQAALGGNSVAGQIKAGKIRALALAGKKRTPMYPDLPTIGETFPGVEASPWLGTFAPAGTPAPVLSRLRDETNRLLSDTGLQAKLAAVGGLQPYISTPEEFAALVRAEHEKYGQIVKAVGAKVD
jgi:tripartite-type tricarboxylate transporter receptor subunit TctC